MRPPSPPPELFPFPVLLPFTPPDGVVVPDPPGVEDPELLGPVVVEPPELEGVVLAGPAGLVEAPAVEAVDGPAVTIPAVVT